MHFNNGDKHFQRSFDFANADKEIRRKKKENKTSIVNDLVGHWIEPLKIFPFIKKCMYFRMFYISFAIF